MLHVLPLSAAADGVFTLSDRTEARARVPDPTTTTQGLGLDLDTVLDAHAVWTAHDATYTLANRPHLSLIDFNKSAIQATLLDNAQASADWRWPRVRLRVSEDASYGVTSFQSVTVLPPPGTPQPATTTTGQPAPLPSATLRPIASGPLLYASSMTSVGSTLELRRWTLSSRVAYGLSGGANASSQASIPFEHGPLAEAIADYRAGHRDHFVTLASGSEASFSSTVSSPNTATDNLLVQIAEQWRHQWAHRTDTMLSAGWYAARTRVGDNAPYEYASDPVAEAAFNTGFVQGGAHEQLHFGLRLSPIINPLLGVVQETIGATVAGSWSHRHVTLTALATAGESIGQASSAPGTSTFEQGTNLSYRLATAELDASYRASKSLMFDGGVRALYQEVSVPPPAPSSLGEVIVFFGVTFEAVKARF
jgi:hypothetical protein